MRYLEDTDFLIDASGGNTSAVRTLYQLSDQGVAVSIVSHGELFEGAYGFPDPLPVLANYRLFLATYQQLPLTDRIMEVFARIRADLRRQGRLIPDLDLLIGATAIHDDLALLTRNLRHFQRVPDLTLHQPT